MDKFIGSVLKNIVVRGIAWVAESNKVKTYSLQCRVCSKDEDLYPEGSITSTKGNLLAGKIPCGCKTPIRYSKEQKEVVVRRLCKARDYYFIGWKDSKTLYLQDNWTGAVSFVACSKFLKGGDTKTRSTSKASARLRVPRKELEAELKNKGIIPSESKLTYLDGEKPLERYTYFCKTCSLDFYSSVDEVSGEFTTHVTNIRKGILPCRCGRSILTQAAAEKYIKTNKDIQFVEWEDTYTNKMSKFKYTCEEGHTGVRTLQQELACLRKCVECYSNYGYYPLLKDKPDTLYLLKVTVKGRGYIKIGRSFDLKERVRQHKYVGFSDIKIVSTFNSTHSEVFKLEQKLLKLSPEIISYKEIKGGSEVRCLTYLNFYIKEFQKCSHS
ncbi:putative meiotically up-regulated protein 113 [Vibrio phage 501E54-1]|nr:putative meiotically up-regulated protein 113 [Vibrio phage 501E54-1]